MNRHIYYKLKEMEKETADALANASDIGKQESLKDSVGELSLYDNHPADLGSENFERAKDFCLHDKAAAQLKKISKALAKFESGEYGFCEKCGEVIEPSRLEALPYAELCMDCMEKDEKLSGIGARPIGVSGRPIEEEVLNPPFSRSFKDDQDYVSYDGEDAWQDVAEYNKLPHIYYEDIDPDEENRGYIEDIENIPTEKGEGGTYIKTRWQEDKNWEIGKKKKLKDRNRE
ncbi:MAG: conjugal transfer protein TraR [Firmicutes bacterium HGW-Firmicutes-13]|nr:MAG: conjugal transfer protein TraR [Firmicutes bacterium HGW-Firmicutes-13]